MTETTHHAYIQTVVKAIEAEGNIVTDWHADVNDPLDAVIVLPDGYCLTWNEETGWASGVENDRGVITNASLRWLNIGVVPDPSEITARLRDLNEGHGMGDATREKTHYRHFDDDDSTHENLRAYSA